MLMVSYCYRSLSVVCASCVVHQLLACEHSRSHSFSPIIIKLARNDHLDNISVKFVYMGHVRSPGSVAQLDARSTGDQEGVSSRLRSGNILSLRLIMKSFLRSFSPFR